MANMDLVWFFLFWFTGKKISRPLDTMEEIDFELCLNVEQHAAVARREKRRTSARNNNTTTTNRENSTAAEAERIRNPKAPEGNDGDKQSECSAKMEPWSLRPRKRTKVSASGSWRELHSTNSHENASEDQSKEMAIEEAAPDESHPQTFPDTGSMTSESSATNVNILHLDMSAVNIDESENDDHRFPLASLVCGEMSSFSSFGSSKLSHFEIYEDPESMDIDDSHLEASWRSSSPDEDKENADDEYEQPGNAGNITLNQETNIRHRI